MTLLLYESAIKTPEDAREALLGADAILVGTALWQAVFLYFS